jgi:hypothetical protein
LLLLLLLRVPSVLLLVPRLLHKTVLLRHGMHDLMVLAQTEADLVLGFYQLFAVKKDIIPLKLERDLDWVAKWVSERATISRGLELAFTAL